MKIKLGILSLFISINCFAHKNKVISKTYGNVKIYLKTGFDYAEIDKIQIIGQLAEKLSQRLHYKDTIFIEYMHDYGNRYLDNLYMLEYNNSNFKIVTGIKSEYNISSNNNGLSVRLYADKINIVNVLKFVEFTIKNKEKTNTYITKKSIRKYRDLDNVIEPIITDATDQKLIDKIISTKSELINDLIKEKKLINGQVNYGIEIYWQNDKFIFEHNNHIGENKTIFLFELKDIYCYAYANVNDILIFIDKNSFYFLDGIDDKEKKLIHIENAIYPPVKVMEFGNELLIFNENSRQKSINIFLKGKNKVISKFE